MIGMTFLAPLLLALVGPLADPAEEARAQDLMREIRCVACENEPISQSSADIASDMRDKVRELIEDGASDAEVRAWFSDRYGEFVLFRPSGKGIGGSILWLTPFALLLIGGGLVVLTRKKGDKVEIAPVAPDAPVHEDETAG
ncbi:MAG: cytochrome c-type biogenesis protein [Hyphomonadaceae bacterium]